MSALELERRAELNVMLTTEKQLSCTCNFSRQFLKTLSQHTIPKHGLVAFVRAGTTNVVCLLTDIKCIFLHHANMPTKGPRPIPSIWVKASRLFGPPCPSKNSSWWSQVICVTHSRPTNLDWKHVVSHCNRITACWTGGTTEMAPPIPVQCIGIPSQGLHAAARGCSPLVGMTRQTSWRDWQHKWIQVNHYDSALEGCSALVGMTGHMEWRDWQHIGNGGSDSALNLMQQLALSVLMTCLPLKLNQAVCAWTI